MPASILAGFGGALVGAIVTLVVRHSDRGAAQLVGMEARITTRLDRIEADVNNLGRMVAQTEVLVNAMLDHPERFVQGGRGGRQ